MKLVGVYELFTIPGEQYTLTSRSRDFDVSDKFFVPHEAAIIFNTPRIDWVVLVLNVRHIRTSQQSCSDSFKCEIF